jgi:hypothetical protein
MDNFRKEISKLKEDLLEAQTKCENFEKVKIENEKLTFQLNNISEDLNFKTMEVARLQKDYEPLKKVILATDNTKNLDF